MSIVKHTCLTIACDVCHDGYQPDDYAVHFSSLAEARDVTLADGWTITTDLTVICGAQDPEHQQAFDALMPAEPATRIPGQLDIDGRWTES